MFSGQFLKNSNHVAGIWQSPWLNLCLWSMVQANDQRIPSQSSNEFFSLLSLFTENKIFLCNWCTFWQSKTRVFRLTRQMLALTATVLTVLKATTQDQCVLCVCCYLLMVIMMRKYAFNLELACCPFAITRLGNSSTRSRSTPYLAKFDLLSCPAGVWQVFTNCLGSVPFAGIHLCSL